MAEIKLKKREEMDPAYCWDLSSLFGSDEEFEKTEQELAKKIEAFRAKQGTMKESAKALYDVLSGLDDISRVFSSLYVYASQKYHQDMGNQKYQGYAGKMDSMMAVLADASSFVEPEILELDEETVTEFEKAYEPLRLYDRILKENFRKKEHILSPEMEAVLAKAGEMASSPDQIFSAFSNADLRFQPVTDEEENQVPLSHGTFVGFLQSKDRRVRKEAFEKYYAEYEKHKNMLAATFGANLKQAAFFADVRKYPSALAASLDGGNIPVSVYDKLLEAIHAKMPAMYRYVALRKKLLGVDELHMYDVLRADRCISSNSLEARVPFGDLDFVTYVMAVDPELKMNHYGKGKYLLRHAFQEDSYLPQEILWREKAAFSDAVGHSMVDYLKEYAESVYTDQEMETLSEKYTYARPFTKESLLYREIFEKYYPGQAEMIAGFWMPNKEWEGCDVNDPSARVLSNYGESGK